MASKSEAGQKSGGSTVDNTRATGSDTRPNSQSPVALRTRKRHCYHDSCQQDTSPETVRPSSLNFICLHASGQSPLVVESWICTMVWVSDSRVLLASALAAALAARAAEAAAAGWLAARPCLIDRKLWKSQKSDWKTNLKGKQSKHPIPTHRGKG